ncbi:hypothetical protein JCM21738_1852 [Mesobacillus boroniphilus JCM 21738]|uniref:Uncharacterized protein n=1 Tax=Mesobacillus boroniphilus JCM 21738 TaxID=1294265 RepID=W4RLT6_9BACI|nr:hypothetical protein JCM21738_1852 [Mesobacillus boroniphilus JCM 21738]
MIRSEIELNCSNGLPVKIVPACSIGFQSSKNLVSYLEKRNIRSEKEVLME